jgi:hypothetical protein
MKLRLRHKRRKSFKPAWLTQLRIERDRWRRQSKGVRR